MTRSCILFILFMAGACKSRTTDSTALAVDEKSGIDFSLGEEFEGGSQDNENQIIDDIIDHAKGVLGRNHPQPPVPRDHHSKSHGCLTGIFETDTSRLPSSLQEGIFAQTAPKSYRTIIRFSNNNSDVKGSDNFRDVRGLGVKLIGVPGKKIIPEEQNAVTQDFLFLATSNFFIKDNAFYLEFLKVLAVNKHQSWLAIHDPKGFFDIGSKQVYTEWKYKNPLDIPFYSATAYRLGGPSNPDRRAVKYHWERTLCSGQKQFKQIPNTGSENYLRDSLRESMKEDACFMLSVQIRPSDQAVHYPVEDSSIDWPQNPSQNKNYFPYIKVGSFHFPAQDFDTPEKNQYCENLRFTPWHSLPEHRPLGRVNRARLKLYQELAKYRLERNKIVAPEPQ